MKLNVFSIPLGNVEALRSKLTDVEMSSVYHEQHEEWDAEFYFSDAPEPTDIPWVSDFSPELASLDGVPKNKLYFGTYIWQSDHACFAFSFGKSHFYLRDFCNHEFGLEMARRIAKKEDIRQKAARRYAGKRKKDIRSYRKDTRLDIESGESIDYLQAATLDARTWGASARFGASILVNPKIERSEITAFLRKIITELEKEPLFDLPRTEVVTSEDEITRYDQKLLHSIMAADVEFEDSSHQLVGVDFLFGGHERRRFQLGRQLVSPTYDQAGIRELRAFISSNKIGGDQVLSIRVKTFREDGKSHSESIKKLLEFTIEDERVFLQGGKWVRFNESYTAWLDESIDSSIEIDGSLESDLAVLSINETDFNPTMADRGYVVGDKNFEIIDLKGYRVEAFDLKKGKTAYAVKFGTPQKVGYACDQAINVYEIIRNEPHQRAKLDIDTFCLWFILDRERPLKKLSSLRSIILKQKLDDWARRSLEVGIRPQVRLSRRPKPDK